MHGAAGRSCHVCPFRGLLFEVFSWRLNLCTHRCYSAISGSSMLQQEAKASGIVARAMASDDSEDDSAMVGPASDWPHSISCELFSPRVLPRLSLFARPQLHDGKLYFAIRPPHGNLSGQLWVSFVLPYTLRVRDDRIYLLETAFWMGSALDTAWEVVPRHSSKNKGKALHINWPLAVPSSDCRHHQLVISRALGFTFLYSTAQWLYQPYDQRSVVHHVDDCHENNLLANLKLEPRDEHTSSHRASKRRRK